MDNVNESNRKMTLQIFDSCQGMARWKASFCSTGNGRFQDLKRAEKNPHPLLNTPTLGVPIVYIPYWSMVLWVVFLMGEGISTDSCGWKTLKNCEKAPAKDGTMNLDDVWRSRTTSPWISNEWLLIRLLIPGRIKQHPQWGSWYPILTKIFEMELPSIVWAMLTGRQLGQALMNLL